MSERIRQAIRAAFSAVEEMNAAFGERLEELKRSGPEAEAQRWQQATQAMRDSGVIYLSWASHYAKAAGVDPTTETDELGAEFLDEGSDFTDPRFPS
jgi:hypothetical protein